MKLNFYQKFFWATVGFVTAFVISLLFAGIANATTFDEDWDSYATDALIAGQGGWQVPYGNHDAKTTGDEKLTSPNSIKTQYVGYGSFGLERYFTTSTNGVYGFSFYTATTSNSAYFTLCGNSLCDVIAISSEITFNAMHIATTNADIWTDVQIQLLGGMTRARVGSQDWSSWSTTTNEYDYVSLSASNSGTDYFYYDELTFTENDGTSICENFLTETECGYVEGCSWWDLPLTSPYLTQTTILGYCVDDDYIPTGWSTTTFAYVDETTCENNGYCWVGNGCYVCDESMTTTSDYAYSGELADFLTNPSGFLTNAFDYFDLRKKFPIGWVYQIYSIFDEKKTELESTTGTTTDSFSFQWNLPGIGTTTIALINFSYFTEEYATQTGIIRNLLVYALWFGFTWIMWRKIQRLSDNINKQHPAN